MGDREQLAMAISLDLELAAEAVTFKGHWLGGGEFGMQAEEVAELADPRLDRRCLLPLQDDSPEGMSGYRATALQSCVEHFGRFGWQVRVIPETRLEVASLTIDRKCAYVYEYLNDDPGPHIFDDRDMGGEAQVEHYVRPLMDTGRHR